MDPVIEFAGVNSNRIQGRQGGGGRGGPQGSSYDAMPVDGVRQPRQQGAPRQDFDPRGQNAAGKRGRGGGQGGALGGQQRRPGSAAPAGMVGQAGNQPMSWQQQELLNNSGPDQRPPKKNVQSGSGFQMQQQGARPATDRAEPGFQARQGGRPQSARPGGVQQSSMQTQAVAHPAPAGTAPVAATGSTGYVTKAINDTALANQSQTAFSDLEISPITKRAMAEVFGYEHCTKVQAQSIPICLSGVDVLAKAKTGTGKTLAFMIPALESLLRKPASNGQIGILVLSPTRELAMQIHTETEKLARFMNMSVQVVIGGTNMNAESKRISARAPHVLVGTPGRVLDHLTNDTSSVGRMMQDLRVLILDEADNLLDMGFRPTIDKILANLPNKERRQTFLFSATFPGDVKSLASYAFRPSYKTVDTVGLDTGTNVQVEQLSCVVPQSQLMQYLCAVIKTHQSQDPDFKVIAFFPTARQTQLYSETFEKMGMPIKEMHSRKSQAYRTRISEEFRAGSGVVMFSSDVSARGVDYPDVSLVVQVGLPSDKDQYVHRVGRTARAGKTGQSLLLLADFEAFFLNKLRDLPIQNMGQLSPAMVEAESAALTRALTKVPDDTKGKAYAAWLGFYKSASGLSMTAAQVVQTANEFSRIIGCLEPPELEAKTVGKMGLKGVPGLRIAGKSSASAGGGGSGRPQSGRGGGAGGGGGGQFGGQGGQGGWGGGGGAQQYGGGRGGGGGGQQFGGGRGGGGGGRGGGRG